MSEHANSATRRGGGEMSEKHTPKPWILGEYDAALGYDCMTGGVKAGPVYLDGAQYGQRPGEDIEPDQLERMMADARLIAAAPDLLEALEGVEPYLEEDPDYTDDYNERVRAVRAAIAKARGGDG